MRKLLGVMAEKGVSGVRLAKEIGMSSNTFYNKINGNSPFNADQIKNICKVLDIVDAEEKAEIFLSDTTQ